MVEFTGIKGVLIENLIGLDITKIKQYSEQIKRKEYHRDTYPYTFEDFLKKFRKGEFGDKGKKSLIGFVFGTNREKGHPECLHPGFVSDAMYIPEIIQSLQAITKNVVFRSFLDVDCDEEVKGTYNLFTTGDGTVNCFSRLLLESRENTSIIKYEDAFKPIFDDFVFTKTEPICRLTHNIFGAVQLFRNPWSKDKRFIIHCGGMGPVGTLSGLYWLNKVFNGSVKNLNYDLDTPVWVVRGEEKSYSSDFNFYTELCDKCCQKLCGNCNLKNQCNKPAKTDVRVHYEGKISNVTTATPIFPRW